MKKNKTMRTMALMLALTLVTACCVGGTLAKYTTDADSSDSARVAAFGVTVTATGDSVFAKTYAKNDSTFTLDTNSVVSTVNVVAPGTSGELTETTISGTPEVAVRVSYSADLMLYDWEDGDGAYYCPIKITVGEDEFDGMDYAAADTFSKAVNAAIEAYSADYKAGTDLSSAAVEIPSVSWAWDYTGNDAKDTALGDAATPATIALNIKTTVTQID